MYSRSFSKNLFGYHYYGLIVIIMNSIIISLLLLLHCLLEDCNNNTTKKYERSIKFSLLSSITTVASFTVCRLHNIATEERLTKWNLQLGLDLKARGMYTEDGQVMDMMPFLKGPGNCRSCDSCSCCCCYCCCGCCCCCRFVVVANALSVFVVVWQFLNFWFLSFFLHVLWLVLFVSLVAFGVCGFAALAVAAAGICMLYTIIKSLFWVKVRDSRKKTYLTSK